MVIDGLIAKHYTETTNCLPVLKSVHLNCGQHLGNVHEGLVGNSTHSGISMLGHVSILIVCVSISQVIAAQMPLGRYSLFGNMECLVILSKHFPGCAKKKKQRKKWLLLVKRKQIKEGRKQSIEKDTQAISVRLSLCL